MALNLNSNLFKRLWKIGRPCHSKHSISKIHAISLAIIQGNTQISRMRSSHFVLFIVCLICIPLESFYHALPLANNSTYRKEQLESDTKRESAGGLLLPSKNVLKLFAQPQEVSKTGATKKPKKTTSSALSHGRELTIPVPKFKTDLMGNWVYNPWAVTFGNVWMDTRFHKLDKPHIPRITVDKLAPHNYYQNRYNRSTVCIGRSTVYNIPRVENWLDRMIYNYTYGHRPVWIELRKEIYEHGNSEECHTIQYDNWRKYLECALMRNMRVEYMIPKYPLHQVGYHGFWSLNEG